MNEADKKTPAVVTGVFVESAGIEPASRKGTLALSTCLDLNWFS